jgi:hypothetical protein
LDVDHTTSQAKLALLSVGQRGHDSVITLLYVFTYHVVPVPAPNYKRHSLSAAEVTKVCYSLAQLCVTSVYLNLFVWRGGDGDIRKAVWRRRASEAFTSILLSTDKLPFHIEYIQNIESFASKL